MPGHLTRHQLPGQLPWNQAPKTVLGPDQLPQTKTLGPTLAVPSTWMARMEPGASCTHKDPGPRPIPSNSSPQPTLGNPGSRTTPEDLSTRWVPMDPSTRLAHLLTTARGLPTCGPQQSLDATSPQTPPASLPESLEGLTGEGLCLPKESAKPRRGAYFSKCTETSPRP